VGEKGQTFAFFQPPSEEQLQLAERMVRALAEPEDSDGARAR
jgi:hypothetical protein